MKKKYVILADDDSDDQFLFSNFLSDHPQIAISPAVANGEELISVLEKIPDVGMPAAIILDQNMPKMNGLSTLHYLKTNKRYEQIPVMVYSTYINDVLVQDCMKAGAALVCDKPVDKEGYHHMITTFFNKIQPALTK